MKNLTSRKDHNKSPITWNTEEVASWINEIGLSQYTSVFRDNKVTGESIFSLNINDLEEMGVRVLGHRIKLLKKLKELSIHITYDVKKPIQKSKEKKQEKKETQFLNNIFVNFILGKDEMKIGLKKTYSLVESRKKVASKMGIGEIKFYHKGKEIIEEKEWKKLIEDEKIKIEVQQTNANEIGETEKNVIENLGDSTFIIDTKGIILYLNSKVEKEIGYKKEYLIGKNIKAIMPEEYASKHDEYLRRYMETGTKKVIGNGRNVKVKLANGTVKDAWLSVNETKQHTGRHQFTGTLHLLDTMDRSNELIENSFKILDCFNESVIVIDDSGCIQFMNRFSESLFFYKLEEVIGQNINVLMPEPYHSRHDGYIRNYLKGGNSKIIGKGGRQVIVKSGKGSIIPVTLEVTEFVSDGKRYFVGVLSRQEKVKTKSVLEESREVIDSLLIAAVIIDQEGIVQALNENCTELLGFKLSDVVGENISIMMNDKDAKLHNSYLLNYLKTGKTSLINKRKKLVAKSLSGDLVNVIVSVSEKENSKGEKIFLGIILPDKK